MVARLASTPPNVRLMRFAADELRRNAGNQLVDIGCGAGCNAIPLAGAGWHVTGTDLSDPMLAAARRRANDSGQTDRLSFERAPMDRLPLEDSRFDFIVAHGIWNLARSADEFRAALREAVRVAKPGAALFVYTFSRSTLPPETEPVPGESFVFALSDGPPRCYLTKTQLLAELDAIGFLQEPDGPINEHLRQFDSSKLAILEGIFRLPL